MNESQLFSTLRRGQTENGPHTNPYVSSLSHAPQKESFVHVLSLCITYTLNRAIFCVGGTVKGASVCQIFVLAALAPGHENCLFPLHEGVLFFPGPEQPCLCEVSDVGKPIHLRVSLGLESKVD